MNRYEKRIAMLKARLSPAELVRLERELAEFKRRHLAKDLEWWRGLVKDHYHKLRKLSADQERAATGDHKPLACKAGRRGAAG